MARQHFDYYHLTADDYAALLARADGLCNMCGRTPRQQYNKTPLVIDHDHALGWRAVRGLICYSCNAALGNLERGRRLRLRQDQAETYLANPWYASVGIGTFDCPPDCEISLHRGRLFAPSGR